MSKKRLNLEDLDVFVIGTGTDVVEKKLIGRNPMSQIRYSFDDVSDKHAYICKKSDGEIVIIDNNSTNGTYVNGSKITSPYVLKKGECQYLQ